MGQIPLNHKVCCDLASVTLAETNLCHKVYEAKMGETEAIHRLAYTQWSDQKGKNKDDGADV